MDIGVLRVNTVNSHYCRHSWDRNLVSVLVRVHNRGVRGKKVFENVFAGRVLFVFTAVRTRAVFACTKTIVIIDILETEQYSMKQNLQKPL